MGPDSNLRGIMAYQAKAYKANAKWKPDDAEIKKPNGDLIKHSGIVLKKAPGDDTTKGQEKKTFHGIEGWVSRRPINTKSLTC